MIVYFVPGVGRFGGIKVAFQFTKMLRAAGLGVVVATPAGDAPTWFRCSVPVVDRRTMLSRLGPDDVAIFSLPHDHAELAATPARLVLHCQGTSPLLTDVVRDERVTSLACWKQAHDWIAHESGRTPIDVGISIADCFRSDDRARVLGRIAVMPRRGRADLVIDAARRHRLDLVTIDGVDEDVVADTLRTADVFVATAEQEWFGLPALEAMASGCVVLSVPVLGGMEYLDDGRNAIVRPIDAIVDELVSLVSTERADERHSLRAAGQATATRYRRAVQQRRITEALTGPLREMLR